MNALRSLKGENFRRSVLACFVLSTIIPILIMLFTVFQYVLPRLTSGQIDDLIDPFTYAILGMFVVPLLGFVLMVWWSRYLEALTVEVKTRSAEVMEHPVEVTANNEMAAIRGIFDQLHNELLGKMSQLNDYSQKLIDSNVKLSEMAITDELTGLYNKRYFKIRLDEEVGRAKRYGHDMALIMFDLDDFKTYNDTYGHQAGDLLLAGLGGLIRRHIRQSDLPFRYGGDEFAVILPQAGLKQAVMTAQKLVEFVARKAFEGIVPDFSGNLSLSCGAATLTTDSETLVGHSDRCLYKAKESGKGRVIFPRPKEIAHA